VFTNITMKNTATYDQSGVVISDLTKLNYFFGNNGCGKSTIAKYLQSISEGFSNQKYPCCEFNGYNPQQEEILVFNQEFIENNFRKNDAIKGVFSLNHINTLIDEQIKSNEKTIQEKTNTKNKLEEDNDQLSINRKNLRDDLSDKCFAKRNIFKTFSKIKLEYSGNKKNNLSYIEKKLEENGLEKFTLEELTQLYKKFFEENLTEINSSINERLYNQLIECQNKINPLLDEVIIGKKDVKLAEMIKEYNIQSWVIQGKNYLEKIGKICPFCQQTITDDFISQLNDIFDESSKRKVDKIRVEKDEYINTFSSFLSNLQEVSQKYNENNVVSNLQIKIKEILEINTKLIEEKIKSPNEKKNLNSLDETINDSIEKINFAIKRNNDIVNTLEEQKKKLQYNIWTFLASECKDDISNYKIEDKKLETKIFQNTEIIKALQTEILKLKQKNVELRTQTINTTEAVDNINQILKNSGFMGFEIIEKEQINNISQYFLSRTGSSQTENIFNSLSEGERNFISFLYFYQLCLGTTDIQANSSKKKIIVIDDPVSSMDSQVLFIVSTLVNRLISYKGKEKTARTEFSNLNINQVFILTHNYYFYKEIAMEKRPICKQQSHYLISKNSNNKTIVSKRKYKERDDYSLMWETIRNAKETLNDSVKEQNILLANLFRRVLESYSNFLGLGNDAWATLLNDKDKDSTEYYLKCAFISMINDESHKVSPFDSMYFQKIHNENPSKLFDVFESIFIGINGKEHYDKMMKP